MRHTGNFVSATADRYSFIRGVTLFVTQYPIKLTTDN